MINTDITSLTPDLPIYANARYFLRILDGVPYALYRSTYNAIWEQRGSLHRFDAVRGTIITTGSFSSGTKHAAFEPGAAPITLIDGEKLLDLLRQYQIGMSKQTIEYFEFDPTKLAQFEVQGAEEPAA
jgi:hypothetical protein